MDETTQQPESSHRESKLAHFGRRHRALTVAGVAAVGLFGGVELAAGVLIGAGVAALLRRPSEASAVSESSAQTHARMHELRQRVEERARAVISAARGEIGVPGHP
jgi:hypothetical protein